MLMVTAYIVPMPEPYLMFAYGNPSRGDDALGPLLLEAIKQQSDLPALELLTDFQLQVEHALDLQQRRLVLFVDAAVASDAPFSFSELQAQYDHSYTSHAMSPQAVMAVYQQLCPLPLPACFLLAIKGESFELGEGISASASEHLQLALSFVQHLFAQPDAAIWRQLAVQNCEQTCHA